MENCGVSQEYSSLRVGLSERILIADGAGEFRDALDIALRKKGFTTLLSSTANETIKIVSKENPSLVVLELLMADLPGEEVCKILKSDPLLKQIPIIVVTSKNDLQTKLSCLDLGVEEFLVKPMEPEEVVARIARLFKLMNQWKGTKESSSRIKGVKSHSETTADILKLTQPTINLPDAPGKSEPVRKSGPIPKAQPAAPKEKSNYGIYRTESIAGTGGMGLVYKAYDQALERYVAVKVLSKEWSSSPEFSERFRREAKLIATINHPGIAQIYTFAQEEGESYFALQWCSGGSLANHIKSRGKVELLPAIDIVEQCAKALEAAFAKSVVHRDIKPSNLMFDENHQVKIVDFGISFSDQMPEKVEPGGAVIGSPAYISPEQGAGTITDHRTDIYSLGITFYQMLYGRLPFTAKSPMEFLEKHSAAAFPSYDSQEGKIPRIAYSIIERMTKKKPADRYQKYSDLVNDLEKLRKELYSQRRLKIPAIQDIDSNGTIQGQNFFDVLSQVFRSGKAGLLKISWATLEKKFLILQNELVHFDSPQKDESVWTELVNKKLMKREDIPRDHEDFEESVNRLLYLGILNTEDFKTAYREKMGHSIQQILLWPITNVEFHPGRILNEPIVRLPLSNVLMKAARSILPLENIQDSIPSEGFIVRSPAFEDRLKALNLSRDENFLATRIEGQSSSIHTLQALTGFAFDQVARTVHALERTGAVKYEAAVERKPRRTAERTLTPPPIQAESLKKVEEVRKSSQREKPKGWLDEAPKPDEKLAAKSFKQAKDKYKEGSYWEVIRLCGQAIQNNPKEASYHYLMALALMTFPHSVRAAVESFRQAIQLEPQNVDYRLQLVTFLKEKSLFQEAYKECEKTLVLQPTNKQAAILMRQIELER